MVTSAHQMVNGGATAFTKRVVTGLQDWTKLCVCLCVCVCVCVCVCMYVTVDQEFSAALTELWLT